MSDAPAGWYPDPTPATSAPGLRYWDGESWTDHVVTAHQPWPAQVVGPTTPDGTPLADWWSRVGAYLIDWVPIWVLTMLILALASPEELASLAQEPSETGGIGYWFGTTEASADPSTLRWKLPIDLLVLTYLVVMLRWKGATLGKLALGLRVRMQDRPGQLPWNVVLLRVAVFYGVLLVPSYFVGSLVLVGALLTGPAMIFSLVDSLWPLWDNRRQALHDKPARTCVVRTR